MEQQPEIFVIAGPNGAGKTTAAYSLLPTVFETVEFVNADEIAKGLSPFNPEGVAFEAGRIMLGRMHELISKGKSFAFETTLSGLYYIRLLKAAQQKGYAVSLFFVHLKDVELAIQRVAVRVVKGGHNIPKNIIERRYEKGLQNFKLYAAIVDTWYLYDNSAEHYQLMASCVDSVEEVFNFDVYNKVLGK